ncbi:centromere-binding protein [Niveomyces insectorum RCEF 264]|uniref:Centromere-binding protein n=1 Tax=Niveomyces insectorum RCEF 264 TaxID=1081102 RepID=A0A167M9R3_9HYPO|nr:centromere-binding protein [Niveomyces insectorum RCEF 264]
MAEAASEQQQQQQQQTDVTPSSPSQKRKRGAGSSSPDARRSKRGTSAATVATPAMETAATAFMEATNQSEQGLSTAEFSVIQNTDTEHIDAAANAANAALAASSTAAAALGSMYPQLHVPPSTAETFANQQLEGEQQQQQQQQQQQHGDTSTYSAADGTQTDSLLDASGGPSNGVGQQKRPSSGIQIKPAVGSEQWHKMRKDNHKEVERRRRETINEGINELAKIVPGCEKNKGSILQRAVVFITQLKENETQNLEKWTLEKLLTEQAIAELSASNDKLKAEVERLYQELETWKRVAQNAGLQPSDEKTESSS